jgi:hypothetical protein
MSNYATRDLMLSDLDYLAKKLRRPGESYEQAFSRALETPEGVRAYEEYRRAHHNIGSRPKPTSSDVGAIRKAMDARESVMYRVEHEAQRRFPGVDKAEAISKFMTTPEGSTLYEEHRKVR